MRRAKQKDFFDNRREHAPRRFSHGGATSAGHRKLQRPLDRKKPVHIVLKSSCARGPLSMLGVRNRLAIDKIIATAARKFGIKLHSKQNVGNHLHLVASFAKRELLQNFLRTISALIARQVTGARRGKPFGKRFWDALAFTRVISGRRDFQGMRRYVDKNRIEAEVCGLARQAVEEYEAAERKARRAGRDVWEFL